MKEFVVFDTEFTTFEGAHETMWAGEGQYRELVQISALKINRETFDEIDYLDLYIKPQFNSLLSDLFIDLTGITNEEVEQKGISFVDTMKQFNDFCEGLIVYSYGNDIAILAENAGYYKEKTSMPKKAYYHNWAHYFHKADPVTKTINSGKLADHFGVGNNIKGSEHNALYDCRSQLEAFKHLYQKGHKLSF